MTSSLNYFLLSLILLACMAGCNKDSDAPNTPVVHDFKGIEVTNDQGEILGQWGTDDGDWETDAAWSAAEYEVLNFPDTVSLDGTFIKDTSGWNTGPGIHQQPRNMIIVYPNPAANRQILYYGGLGLLKFKAAIVDKFFSRIYTFAKKDSSEFYELDFSDTVKFRNGVLYRLYYSLSAKDSLNFYKGHGDILICRNPVLQDCQKYVP